MGPIHGKKNTQLRGVEASAFQHHNELGGSAPTFGVLSDAETSSPCNRQPFLKA